jgi:porin
MSRLYAALRRQILIAATVTRDIGASMQGRRTVFAGCFLLAVLASPLAGADAADDPPPTDLWHRDTMTGDWGGVRSGLADRGIAFGATYIGESLGNLSGGISRGAIYEGRLELDADLDLDKLAGWRGATLHASAHQLHGHALSHDLANLLVPSNIEARPTTRLFTLWLEQSLAGDSASLRIGQLAADDEFIVSATASMFMNSTFGWPAFASINLPSGGPAFPLATPGARLRIDASENFSVMGAMFSGDPAGRPGALDPQLRDISGTQFSFSGGTLMIGEAAYSINQGDKAPGLPGTYKLGAWYHTGGFADQRIDRLGRSLASPASTGVPLRHRSDYAVYAVADQTVWQGASRSIDLFMRASVLPSDRNLIAFYLDAGAAYNGLFEGRPDDKLGLGFAYAPIGSAARGLDRDAAFLSGAGFVRDYESVLEISYQAKLAPWWILQPDLQLLFHPGGTIANPRTPTQAIGDAVVIGLRTTFKL